MQKMSFLHLFYIFVGYLCKTFDFSGIAVKIFKKHT